MRFVHLKQPFGVYLKVSYQESSPDIPVDLILKRRPSCQTLSKAFDISKNTDLTSKDGLQSNASNIS